MAKHDNIKAGFKNITRLKVLMILGYAFIIIISIVVVSVLAVRKTDTVLKNKVSTMSSSLNVQMKLNLDSYLSRMETIGALAFGSEEAYTSLVAVRNGVVDLKTGELQCNELFKCYRCNKNIVAIS